MSEHELTWLDAWQQPPSWQAGDARLDGCVLAGEPVAQQPLPAVYDSLGLLFGGGLVGWVALRAMRRQLALVRAIEAEDVPVAVEVDDVVVRSRSGIEAKDDVEAHTKSGKRLKETA